MGKTIKKCLSPYCIYVSASLKCCIEKTVKSTTNKGDYLYLQSMSVGCIHHTGNGDTVLSQTIVIKL